jgi:hypothetical protein
MENRYALKNKIKIDARVKILEEKLWPSRHRVDTIQYNSSLISSKVPPATKEEFFAAISVDLLLYGEFNVEDLTAILDNCFPFKNFILLNLFNMPVKPNVKINKFYNEIFIQFHTLYEFMVLEIDLYKTKSLKRDYSPKYLESQRLMAMDILREICVYIISNVNIADSFFITGEDDVDDDIHGDVAAIGAHKYDDDDLKIDNGDDKSVNLSNYSPSPDAESMAFKAWAIFFSKGILCSGVLAISTAFKYSQSGSYVDSMDMFLDSIPPLLFLAINSYSAEQFRISSDKLGAALIVSATQMFTSTRLTNGSDWRLQLGSGIMIVNVFPVIVGLATANHSHSVIPIGLTNAYICFKDYMHDGTSIINYQITSNNFTAKRNSTGVDDYDEYVIFLLMEAYIQIPLLFIKFDIGRILDILPVVLIENARYVISIVQSNYFTDTQRIVANMIGDVNRIREINQENGDKLRIQQKIRQLSPTFRRVHEFLWSKKAHYQMKNILSVVDFNGIESNAISLSKIDASLVSYIKRKVGIIQLSQFVIYIDGLKSVQNIDNALSNIDYFLKIIDDLRIRRLLTIAENLAFVVPKHDWLLIPSIRILSNPASFLLISVYQSFNSQLLHVSNSQPLHVSNSQLLHVSKKDAEKSIVDLMELSFPPPWEPQNVSILQKIAKISVLRLPPSANHDVKNNLKCVREFDSAMFENCLIPSILNLAEKLDGENRYLVNIDGYFTVKNFLSIPLFKNLLRRVELLILEQSMQTKLIILIQSTMSKLISSESLHELLVQDVIDIAGAIDDDLELTRQDINYGSEDGENTSSFPSKNEIIQIIKETVVEPADQRNMERSHFLRMFKIPFVLENNTKYFHGENMPNFFSDCFKYFIKEGTSALIPSTNQTIFMDFWTSSHFQSEASRGNSYTFLKKIYDANRGLFWMPLVLHIIHTKNVEVEAPDDYLKHYLTLAIEMGISGVDAGVLFDFLCTWIYQLEIPDNYQKLLSIRRILQNSFDDFKSRHAKKFI